MEEQLDKSRQVGREKGFYVAKNSSVNDKDQGNKSMSRQRVLCRDNNNIRL